MGDDLSLRARVYRVLDPGRGARLGWINRLLVVLIIVATVLAVIETEPLIASGREQWFRLAELGLGSVFVTEYLVRLWTAPENPRWAGARFPRLRHAVSPMAIIDLLAILPMLLALAGGSTILLRFFRLLRILRLAKLGRFSQAWTHLAQAIHSRRHELILTLCFAGTVVLIASTILFWAEGEAQPDKFGSIPRSFWWAVVTLTTVGYGDAYPVTAVGKFFAGIVALAGIGLIALPAGILAGAFSDAVQRSRDQQR